MSIRGRGCDLLSRWPPSNGLVRGTPPHPGSSPAELAEGRRAPRTRCLSAPGGQGQQDSCIQVHTEERHLTHPRAPPVGPAASQSLPERKNGKDSGSHRPRQIPQVGDLAWGLPAPNKKTFIGLRPESREHGRGAPRLQQLQSGDGDRVWSFHYLQAGLSSPVFVPIHSSHCLRKCRSVLSSLFERGGSSTERLNSLARGCIAKK